MEAQTTAVETKPKPSGWVYILPLAIFLVGSGFAIYLLVAGFQRRSDVIDNFARFDTKSTATVELKSEGTYTVWVELPATTSSSSFEDPDTSVLVKNPQGDPLAVRKSDEAFDSYTHGSREGTAVYEFKAAKQGEYSIGAVYNENGPAKFAVGRDNPDGEAAKGVLLFFVVGSIALVVSLILLIVIMVMRGRSKRRIRAARMGQGAPFGGYAAPAFAGTHGAQSGYGVPTYGAPSYGAPSYGGPSYGGPSYGAPAGPPYGAPEPGHGDQAAPDPYGGTPAFGADPSADAPWPPQEGASPPPPPGWAEGPPPSP